MPSNKYWEKYLHEFIIMGGHYVPPDSSGRDGYTIKFNDFEQYVPNDLIDKAYNYAQSVVLGFIKGDNLWVNPYSEIIRYREFTYNLNRLLTWYNTQIIKPINR